MLEVGDKAPDFELVDHQLQKFRLSEQAGKVILVFYPGAFTSVCERELCTFRDSMAKLNKAQATVVGISVDTPFSNKAFAEKNGFGFRLLSDFGGNVAKGYGGVHENFLGIDGYTVSKRAVFVLKGGEVKYVWVTENPGAEPPYDEIIQIAESV